MGTKVSIGFSDLVAQSMVTLSPQTEGVRRHIEVCCEWTREEGNEKRVVILRSLVTKERKELIVAREEYEVKGNCFCKTGETCTCLNVNENIQRERKAEQTGEREDN